VFFYGLLALFNSENLFTCIITASLAYTVALYKLTALGALYHAGKNELPIVRSSFVSASLRNFSLWYCHNYTSSKSGYTFYQFI
jgi:hypothetical protein